MQEEQLELCSVLDHDTEPIQKKTRKKISEKERIKCGDFIADSSKEGVKQILENMHRKEISLLDRLKLRKIK